MHLATDCDGGEQHGLKPAVQTGTYPNGCWDADCWKFDFGCVWSRLCPIMSALYRVLIGLFYKMIFFSMQQDLLAFETPPEAEKSS